MVKRRPKSKIHHSKFAQDWNEIKDTHYQRGTVERKM